MPPARLRPGRRSLRWTRSSSATGAQGDLRRESGQMDYTTMSASKLYEALIAAETDGENAADMRRVLGEERQALHVRIGRVAAARKRVERLSGARQAQALLELDAAVASLETARREAARVAAMWM